MLKTQNNYPLKNKTSFNIGGVSKYYFAPKNISEIIKACVFSKEKDIPIFVLGKGTNILVSDKGWHGIVIDVSEHLTKIRWIKNKAICQSGALLNVLVREAAKKNYLGIEKLAGIPGTVGGAIVMNAGAFGQQISDTLVSVEFLFLNNLQREKYNKSQINFSYRNSIFKTESCIILSALFNFYNDKSKNANKIRLESLLYRKKNHPLNFPNCGSVFKNPPNISAGKLIEDCKLKGISFGDAQISQKHANFIINKGNARAEDVRKLIAFVQKEVYEKTKIILEPEVIFVGDFETELFKP
jgi:UDP-N-acetylmuramate dehydrogenase